MTKHIIEIYEEELQALRAAVLVGALGARAEALVAILKRGDDDSPIAELELDRLRSGSMRLFASPMTEESYRTKAVKDATPWTTMTTDDWIRASNYMVTRGEQMLSEGHGGFMTAWHEAMIALGRAHNRADTSNQAMVRYMCGAAFYAAHLERLGEEQRKGF